MLTNIISMYTTYVVSIANIKSMYMSDLDNLTLTYQIRPDQYEHLFDWIVQQAFLDLMPSNTYGLQQHYRHDVFKLIYETHYKYVVPVYITSKLRDIQVTHPSTGNHIYKLMVCGDILFISKGI